MQCVPGTQRPPFRLIGADPSSLPCLFPFATPGTLACGWTRRYASLMPWKGEGVGKTRGKDLWVLLLGCALALTVLTFSYVGTVDDAYISFRYAHNLAEGEGLVFNPGEYVEGYTNLLWTLLMTLPEALGIPVHFFAVYLGLGFGLLALFEAWRICRLLGLSSWGTAAAVLVLGAYPDF
jgi:arabinofuranosyltransferase